MTTAQIKRNRNIKDVVTHNDLLNLYADYVRQEIDDNPNKARPLGFNEWRTQEYDDHTMIVRMTVRYETASGGFLSGSGETEYRVRIPADVVTESGGILDADKMKVLGYRLANKTHHRLPTVLFKGKVIYQWTNTL